MFLFGRTQMLSDYNYDDSLRVFREVGFDGAEISILDKAFMVRPEIFSEETLTGILDTAESLDLTLSVSCHIDYVNKQENFNTVIKAMKVARDLRSSLLIINGALKQAETLDEEALEWQRTVEKTKALCTYAEYAGVDLALEFEPGFVIDSTEQLLKLMEEVDSPNLKANLDLGHAFLCDPDPMASIAALSDKIVHCHIEDMKEGIHDHLLPGEGDMDLGEYIEKLKVAGFNGALALDLYKYDYRAVSADAINKIRKLL